MMHSDDDKYAAYVDHPRYGRSPRYTGANPGYLSPEVSLHWNSTSYREIAERYRALTGQTSRFDKWLYDPTAVKRIPGTAITANLARQTAATVPVTHYFDLERKCQDCGTPFIFFAEEQKYWYEELGFGLDSDCVRCVVCRKQQQAITRLIKRYEELCHTAVRSNEENLEMADCLLSLIESFQFTPKQLPRVRALLNRVDVDTDQSRQESCNALLARVRQIDATHANKRNGS
jgi:hypothetical protein